MAIIAKVSCWANTDNGYGGRSVKFMGVHSGSEENKSFATATPDLQISMTIDNPEAMDYPKVGKEYLITFKEVES